MTPSKQRFSELKWLPFPERVKYHTHVMMYKILNNMAPDFLRQLFHNVSETHERALRSADNELLTTPLCRTIMKNLLQLPGLENGIDCL